MNTRFILAPPCHAPEHLGGGPTVGALAQVRSAVVVELEVPIQGRLQGPHVGEEPTAEFYTPQLAENGSFTSWWSGCCNMR